jgi:ATP-binding cassette, subfamily A (ABC1), member 3
MGVFRQTWVLTKKNLLIVARRHWFATTFRALVLPVIYIFLISYVRNFFLPPSVYGFGESTPLRNASTAFQDQSSRDRVVLINNGFTTGAIAEIIDELNSTYSEAGADVRLASEDDLPELCRSSLTGTSRCYGAISITSSPSQGPAQINGDQMWSYTAYVDWGLGLEINVDSDSNDAQTIVLPFIRAVDDAIARASGQELPQTMYNIPFTSRTLQERQDQIQRIFMSALVRYLGLVIFIAVCGITYHLPGHVARERELGMSSLIDIMNPQKGQWLSHAARILATNSSFSAIYLPGILVVGGIISGLIFIRSSSGMVIAFHVLACLSLSVYSTFMGSFFRRAQLSGITVVIVSCVLAIVAQWAAPSILPVVIALSLLFPPANYVYWVMYVASWEQRLRGASWTGAAPRSSLSALPGWWFYVAAFVHVLAFPLLTLWSEKARYGTSSARRQANNVTLNSPHAINLVGFSKTYYPGFWKRLARWKSSKPVYAVVDLSFAALRGQVVALLGRNGAGKSTTMAAITSQEKFTSGLIELDGGGGLGFCPQKNVLWDELTVLEHVRIFNQLKAGARRDSKSLLRGAIDACDLLLKVNAKSKTLSGGQKRKLQLAMAFTGGSRVCCVDEASSGLDPVSRRKIWDILLAERGHRTIIFTTHALDEADALADHIVMMEQGHLTMEGPAVELKQRYGGDYLIRVPQPPTMRIPADIRARYTREKSAHVFHIAEPSHVGRFVAFLEAQGVNDYEVQGPTIETVFLRQAEQDPEYTSIASQANKSGSLTAVGYNEINDFRADTRSAARTRPVLPQARKLSFIGQWWVLYRKRLSIFPRSYVPYIFALGIPIVTAYLATRFLRGFELLICSPSALVSGVGAASVSSLALFVGTRVPVGPSDEFNAALINALVGGGGVQNSLRRFDTYSDWTSYIQQNYQVVSPGGLWLGNTSSDHPTIAYRADGGLYYAAATLSVSNSYLSGIPTAATFSTFALPILPSTGDSLQLIVYFGLAMAIVPGLFALYPSYERLRNIRALQYSNGVRPAPLWLAHLAFDAFFVIGFSIAALVIFVNIRADAWYSAPHLWPVFFFYGLSATLFSYVVSLGFKSQLGAFAFAAGYQAIGLLIYFFL